MGTMLMQGSSPIRLPSLLLLLLLAVLVHRGWTLQMPTTHLVGGGGRSSRPVSNFRNGNSNSFNDRHKPFRSTVENNHYNRKRVTSTSTSTSSHQQHRPAVGTGGRATTTTTTTTTTALSMVFTVSEEQLSGLSTMDMLDQILDECLRTSARRPIMVQFNPSSKFIWKHWRGTVFSDTWKSCVRLAIWASIVYFLFNKYPITREAFSKFNLVWGQLLSVTTFTLTFFVNKSYEVWRDSLTRCRMLQGRLNDLLMALAGFANRVDVINGRKGPGEKTVAEAGDVSSSQFTNASRNTLVVVGRYIRLFNLLSYASLTRSHRPLITPQGMRRLENRGLMTGRERQVLNNLPVPANQRHNAILMWILRMVIDGRKAGHLDGGFGFEQQMMSKIQEIRAQANSMESVLRGRMPFAYAHIVQVLVDAVIWMYPLMAFSNGMDMSFHLGVFGAMVLTSAYKGLFDLSKQLLDPFHNENFWKGEDALNVDTLIAETNAASMRWMYCLDEMPISYQSIRKGELDEFILPNEGFSKEDADAASEEQDKQKQQAREEKQLLALIERDETNKTVQEIFQEQAIEEIEADLEELESTKLILEAPPGSDFVPGLDDKNETLSSDTDVMVNGKADASKKLEEMPEALEVFIHSAEEELEEKHDSYSLGLTSITGQETNSLSDILNQLKDNFMASYREEEHNKVEKE